MLHDKLPLLADAILDCDIEQSQQLLLLWHVEAGKYRDVVLALRAEGLARARIVDEVPTFEWPD